MTPTNPSQPSRRRALRSVAGIFAAPLFVPASALGRQGATPPSDRIVMGCIGVGSMGGGHVRGFLAHKDVRVAAVCDVRAAHRERAKRDVDGKYGDTACAAYNDFRELLARPDIDAVLIATPEHWHALIAIEAACRGKHMYCEKPIALTLAEAKAVRGAVLRHGVTFQLGTQQRSSQFYRYTCELVRNGRIGELRSIIIGSARGSENFQPDTPDPVPEGFDYDRWLGPAPWVPHNSTRCTRNFTLCYDYSLGCIGGAWGVHDVDTAQWFLDADATGPVEAEGFGIFPSAGVFDTAHTWEVEHRYANGIKLIHMDLASARKRADQFRFGSMASVVFGSEGWIWVSRQGLRASNDSILRSVVGPNENKVPVSDDHRRNFLDAIRTGRRTISHIESAVRSEAVCQQCDIAMRLQRKLRWDPAKEEFIGDEQANRMLSRPMRSPWHV